MSEPSRDAMTAPDGSAPTSEREVLVTLLRKWKGEGGEEGLADEILLLAAGYVRQPEPLWRAILERCEDARQNYRKYMRPGLESTDFNGFLLGISEIVRRGSGVPPHPPAIEPPLFTCQTCESGIRYNIANDLFRCDCGRHVFYRQGEPSVSAHPPAPTRKWVSGEKDHSQWPVGVLNHGPIFWMDTHDHAATVVGLLNDFERYLGALPPNSPEQPSRALLTGFLEGALEGNMNAPELVADALLTAFDVRLRASPAPRAEPPADPCPTCGGTGAVPFSYSEKGGPVDAPCPSCNVDPELLAIVQAAKGQPWASEEYRRFVRTFDPERVEELLVPPAGTTP